MTADLIERLQRFCRCAVIAPRTCTTCETIFALTAQAERIAELVEALALQVAERFDDAEVRRKLEKDAARYRWLRVRHSPHVIETQLWQAPSWNVIEGTELDAALDSAMKGDKP